MSGAKGYHFSKRIMLELYVTLSLKKSATIRRVPILNESIEIIFVLQIINKEIVKNYHFYVATLVPLCDAFCL